jgi:UDP-N-acetyl-2-amino-2-deoxyglucuronate dehydrogenase
MTVYRVAIVGSGVIAHNHVKAIARHPQLEITTLVDILPAANEKLAATLDTPVAMYDSIDAAIAAGGFDIAVICTPSGSHTELAEAAIAAGIHVVIEKPIDASLAAGRRLAKMALDNDATVTVISQHRFDPASIVVERAIDAGEFGRITSAVASVAWWRSQAYYDSAGWRGTWLQDGGGATCNQGIHTVDLLLWFLGKPVEVYAQTGTLAHERIEVEDVAVATVRFTSGALAVLHATTAAFPGLDVRIQVHGSTGSAVIQDDQLVSFHTAGTEGNQAADLVPAGERGGDVKDDDWFVDGHLRQYHDIVDAIDKRRWPGVTADDALLALATVKAIYLSAHLHAPVSIDAILDGSMDATLAKIEGTA